MNFSAADRLAREVRARRKPLDIDEPISPANPLAIGTSALGQLRENARRVYAAEDTVAHVLPTRASEDLACPDGVYQPPMRASALDCSVGVSPSAAHHHA
jgi:hypothetical protein